MRAVCFLWRSVWDLLHDHDDGDRYRPLLRHHEASHIHWSAVSEAGPPHPRGGLGLLAGLEPAAVLRLEWGTPHLEYCIRQHVTVTAFIRLNNTLMSGRLPTKIQIKTAVQRTTSLCVNVSGAYVPEGLMTSCTWDYMTFTPSVRAYTMLLFIFVFFLPLFIIIYCYIFIFRAIRTTNQSVWISNVFRSALPDFSDWLKLVCVSGQWGRLTAVFTVMAALVIPWRVSTGCRTSGRWRRSRSSSSCSTSSPGRRTPPSPSPPSPGKTLKPPHLWKRVCHLSQTTTKLWALCRWTSSDGH